MAFYRYSSHPLDKESAEFSLYEHHLAVLWRASIATLFVLLTVTLAVTVTVPVSPVTRVSCGQHFCLPCIPYAFLHGSLDDMNAYCLLTHPMASCSGLRT